MILSDRELSATISESCDNLMCLVLMMKREIKRTFCSSGKCSKVKTPEQMVSQPAGATTSGLGRRCSVVFLGEEISSYLFEH